jgi:hypothetical protein
MYSIAESAYAVLFPEGWVSRQRPAYLGVRVYVHAASMPVFVNTEDPLQVCNSCKIRSDKSWRNKVRSLCF